MSLPKSRDALLAALDAGETFEYLTFWGHRRKKDHGVDASCLSQWYPASFVVGGSLYPTAEHWMMAEKARLFADHEVEAEILAVKDPGEVKALGRRVRGYDDARWAAHRFDAVVAGNEHKFGQNRALGAFLVDTGHRVLVEASPRDAVWGVGLGAERATDPRAWRGQNLLGFALMVVRERMQQVPDSPRPD